MKLSILIAAAGITVSAASPVLAADGAQLFKSRCGSCHWDPTTPGAKPRMGPPLGKIIGKKAGAEKSFTRYSAAMKSAGFTWTADKLDAYLDNPRKVVPGTGMAFAGLKKPDERKAVIAYLMSASSK